MRRSSVIKRLVRRLKILENCHLGYAEANEILKIVEECEPTLYNSWDWKIKKRRKT